MDALIKTNFSFLKLIKMDKFVSKPGVKFR